MRIETWQVDPNRKPQPRDNVAVVYSCEDASGAIIYVGRTANWRTRWAQHAADKPWWGRVVNVHCVVYRPTPSSGQRREDQARTIERLQIADEAYLIYMHEPRHNLDMNPARDITRCVPTPRAARDQAVRITSHSPSGRRWAQVLMGDLVR